MAKASAGFPDLSPPRSKVLESKTQVLEPKTQVLEPKTQVLESKFELKTQIKIPTIEELAPCSLWRHFRGKIFWITTADAVDYNHKNPLIVFQDIKNPFPVFVRLLSEFQEILPGGKARYTKFEGSLKEAHMVYGK